MQAPVGHWALLCSLLRGKGLEFRVAGSRIQGFEGAGCNKFQDPRFGASRCPGRVGLANELP